MVNFTVTLNISSLYQNQAVRLVQTLIFEVLKFWLHLFCSVFSL